MVWCVFAFWGTLVCMEMLEKVVNEVKAVDDTVIQEAKSRHNAMAIPRGSLGRLHELSTKVVGVAGSLDYRIHHKVVAVMAGDHGVAQEGVSLFPQEVTQQMVHNFLRGKASISVLARHVGARVVVVDMGVNGEIEASEGNKGAGADRFVDKKVGKGTANICRGPAMTGDEAIRSICGGIEVFEEEWEKGVHLIGTGDMGIANTTPSAAVVAAAIGGHPAEIVGYGTGIDERTRRTKVEVVERALEVNKPRREDAVDMLTKVGGYEIGGLMGWILAACSHGVPVVIDGFISTGAALLAVTLAPRVKDYLIAGHRSQEKGHSLALDFLGLDPVIDLEMRLGEGTGAALAIGIVEASLKLFHEVASFGEARVTDPEAPKR